jgi:hypothetical protein
VGSCYRLSTETKAAFKTTEFFAYVGAVVAVLIASMVVGDDDGHADYFRADQAWLYIVILTVGYMTSRGLAKSGSPRPLRRIPLSVPLPRSPQGQNDRSRRPAR